MKFAASIIQESNSSPSTDPVPRREERGLLEEDGPSMYEGPFVLSLWLTIAAAASDRASATSSFEPRGAGTWPAIA